MDKTIITAIISMVAMSTLAIAASRSPTAKTPKAGVDAGLVSKGHSLFLSNCAPCHGANAQGDDGPNLHHANLGEDRISSTVTLGVKDEMPSFRSKLKGGDLKAVVAYVHSLQ